MIHFYNKIPGLLLATGLCSVAITVAGCNSVGNSDSNVVYYRDYGAKGDGVTDDFDAIIAAHAAANKTGATVRATAGAKYYIGGAAKTARVETNTDWRNAEFIIDDSAVQKNGAVWRDSWIFDIVSAQPATQITSVQTFSKGQEKLELSLPYAAVLAATDSSTRRYIRRGPNENPGTSQTDVFIVDKDGNVDPSAPIIWDFQRVTSLTAYPIDEQVLTITGGKFTTIANRGVADDNYMKRGIRVMRSNTVIDGLVHLITQEGDQGAAYDAFIKFENCANVTIRNSTLTGHRGYRQANGVTRGSYDINATRTISLSVINCDQTNAITNSRWWGIFASNYSKNILFDHVKFSRFDAHQGVRNVTILNSELGYQSISIIGSGLMRVENTKVYSDRFIGLRDDYGSTWEGEVLIRDCTLAPITQFANARIIDTNNDGQWDFGYPCYMPETITIDGFTVEEAFAPASYNGILLVRAVNTGVHEPFPYALTKTINLSRFVSKMPFRMPNSYISSQIEVRQN